MDMCVILCRLLFVGNWHQIYIGTMDGSYWRQVHTAGWSFLTELSSLVYDTNTANLYYADRASKKIMKWNTQTRKVTVVSSLSYEVFSMAMCSSNLMWVDFKTKSIHMFDINTSNATRNEIVATGVDASVGIVASCAGNYPVGKYIELRRERLIHSFFL